MRSMLILAVLALLCVMGTASADVFTGTLTSDTGGLLGTGFWVNDNQEQAWFPASFTYTVSQNPNFSWHYKYELTVYRAAISHMILETSLDFDGGDFWHMSGPFEKITLTTHPATGTGQPNPYMPSDVYGMKFDEMYGTTAVIEFNSWRVPIWGDFYAKCGMVGGTQNTVWNAGFTDPDTDPDIAQYHPADGPALYHILIPDTEFDTIIPEPGTLFLLGGGIAGLGSLLRRRRNSR